MFVLMECDCSDKEKHFYLGSSSGQEWGEGSNEQRCLCPVKNMPIKLLISPLLM